MATGRARSARKLKPWLIEQIDSNKYYGLMWDDEQKICFRIPWKHAGKQDFRHDEDAAIFKAWAQYKNKYQKGDKLDAAAWKTRLRCALNKSPEFQEVPQRSQLDISEPYKVYRIVPVEEQEKQTSEKVSKKRKSTSDSKTTSSDEAEVPEKKPNVILNLFSIETQEATSCASADSGNGSDTSNNDLPIIYTQIPKCETYQPEPDNTISTSPEPDLLPHSTHKEMQVTVLYSGVEVLQSLIRSGECKLSAKSPVFCSMEHVLLPPPAEPLDKDIQKKTRDLMKFLEAGIMLASNSDGIFAQRQKLCSGRIYWTGPCTDSQGTINKLERDKYVKLFDTQNFRKELEFYKQKGGNPPEYHVTLCFGEEFSNSDPTEDKLITAKIEQVIASELVQEAESVHAARVPESSSQDLTLLTTVKSLYR